MVLENKARQPGKNCNPTESTDGSFPWLSPGWMSSCPLASCSCAFCTCLLDPSSLPYFADTMFCLSLLNFSCPQRGCHSSLLHLCGAEALAASGSSGCPWHWWLRFQTRCLRGIWLTVGMTSVQAVTSLVYGTSHCWWSSWTSLLEISVFASFSLLRRNFLDMVD